MTNNELLQRRAQLWAELELLGDPRTFVDATDNPILDVDSYKLCHQALYRRIGVEAAYTYIEPRIKDTQVLMAGTQMHYKRIKPITHAMVDQAKEFFSNHIGNGDKLFPEADWRRVVDEFGGYPPLTVYSIPEGTVVPSQNALVTIECDVPELAWMAAYFETRDLRGIWYPTTVATKSFTIRQLLRKYAERTSDLSIEEAVAFMYHDFGGRGVSSKESAGLGDAAHLIAGSMGTDTITGVLFANQFYNTNMSAFSVFATEHSVMTMRGREGELDTVRDCIAAFNTGPGSIVSLVSDGYDIFNLCKHYCTTLREEIIASGIRLVVRPDSGDPVDVITKLITLFDEHYGSVVNSKGYKVLNVVRILQGDGLTTVDDFDKIAKAVTDLGFGIENMVFGQGGGLLQMVNRDDLKFAQKTCAAKINGKWVDVFKDPITDAGKKSKKGRIRCYKNRTTGEYATLRIDEVDMTVWEDAMVLAYDKGRVVLDDSLDTIRARSVNIK